MKTFWLVCIAAACTIIQAASPPRARGGEAALEAHWSRPARAVMEPAGLSPYPRGCGACHRQRLAEWSGSLHSRSVGPGLTAQLDPMGSPGFALGCYKCHAPLLEQSEVLAGGGRNPSFDEELKKTGVGCAACHLRAGVIAGPPGLSAPAGPDERPPGPSPHPGRKEAFFEEAAFCGACHQLDDGYELNGKPLTNTFAEWKASPYGEQNITCQACHMPGRAHLFRGIHDPEMTLSGLEIRAGKTGRASAVLEITNAAIGHYFPTYVTPAVVVRGLLQDPGGSVLKGSVKEAVIARRVPVDLSTEEFDTRIAPLGTFRFEYDAGQDVKGAKTLVLEVRVYPDEFYNRFFKALLGRENPPEVERGLARALEATEQSEYLLFKRELSVRE